MGGNGELRLGREVRNDISQVFSLYATFTFMILFLFFILCESVYNGKSSTWNAGNNGI